MKVTINFQDGTKKEYKNVSHVKKKGNFDYKHTKKTIFGGCEFNTWQEYLTMCFWGSNKEIQISFYDIYKINVEIGSLM